MRFRQWIELKGRKKRQMRVRNKISGTPERPRISVHRSLNHFFAQIVDDEKGHTLFSLSTMSPAVKGKIKSGGNTAAAKVLGELVAKAAVEKGIKKVVFDRAGYMYHGRVKAFAEEARKGGLEF